MKFLHTILKDINGLEQICCEWLLRFTFSLNKAIFLVLSIGTVQERRTCTAVVNNRVKNCLMLHVEIF